MRWWHVREVAAIDHAVFGVSSWTLEQFYLELASSRRWLQVAVDQAHRVLGYVDVSIVEASADLMTIAVAPDHHRHGIGQALLDAAIAHASQQRATEMFLEVGASNAAQHWYRANGFRQLERRRAYYPDGDDAYVMRRPIRTEEQR